MRLVITMETTTERVVFRIQRFSLARLRWEYESPPLSPRIDQANALGSLRQWSPGAYLILEHPKLREGLTIQQLGETSEISWDHAKYTLRTHDLMEALELPDRIAAPSTGPAVLRSDADGVFPEATVELVRGGDFSIRLENRRCLPYLSVVVKGRATESHLLNRCADLGDRALGDGHNWLVPGVVAIRRISGTRFGVYLTTGLVGYILLETLKEAFPAIGIFKFKGESPSPRTRAAASTGGEWANDSGDGGFWDG